VDYARFVTMRAKGACVIEHNQRNVVVFLGLVGLMTLAPNSSKGSR
jgi:hypothetical protein